MCHPIHCCLSHGPRRWLRVLFCREFQLENALTLWDTIFADSADLGLVDYICASMLCYIRDDCMCIVCLCSICGSPLE
jgi:hypothetical protein